MNEQTGNAQALIQQVAKALVDEPDRVSVEQVEEEGVSVLELQVAEKDLGKVTLSLQNRTVEYQAMTSRQELPTGAKVVVVGVISPDTVEVLPATEPERISHV